MLYRFKYPKLTFLILSIILAYFLFSSPEAKEFVSELEDLSYFGVFIAGLLVSFGFTAPFSAGFFIVLNPEHVLLNGIIGACGAALSNLFIFSLMRFSLKDEFLLFKKQVKKVKLVKEVEKAFQNSFHSKIKHYLMYVFIGFLIASPLPDEFADMILAGFTKIKPVPLLILSFILHFIGICILLLV